MESHNYRNRRGLAVAFCLTVAVMLVEVVGGYLSGSLALLSDAGHMAGDAGALALSLLAMWLAAKPPTPEHTFGLRRSEILAALLNAVSLMIIAVLIWREAYVRFHAPPEVDFRSMLGIAAVGLVANLASAFFLRHHQHSLNVRGAFLHVVGDALGSVGVVAAAAIIGLTGWQFVDPLISVGVGGLVAYGGWGLLVQTLNILLEATPSHLSYTDIQEALQQVPGVVNVHDLHVWTITSGFEALSCHVVAAARDEHQELLERLGAELHHRFGIDHVTIQIETEDLRSRERPGCEVDCQAPS